MCIRDRYAKPLAKKYLAIVNYEQTESELSDDDCLKAQIAQHKRIVTEIGGVTFSGLSPKVAAAVQAEIEKNQKEYQSKLNLLTARLRRREEKEEERRTKERESDRKKASEDKVRDATRGAIDDIRHLIGMTFEGMSSLSLIHI